jgi:2'-5' RNA ligase
MLRLFVAVDLPDQLREEVAQWMGQVRHLTPHATRWVKTEQLHITLRFLGDTPEENLPQVQDQLTAVKADCFHLRLRGAGVFPEIHARKPRKPPKVLWLGIEPTTELVRLKQSIDTAMTVDPAHEKQVFSPHLTLARLSSPPDPTVTHFLMKNQTYTSPDWPVTAFHLYQSTLRREGAIHARLASYPLAQPERRE